MQGSASKLACTRRSTLNSQPTVQGRPIAQQQPYTDLRPWFTSLHDLEPPLDWTEFFQNERPVELDVGCGRGLFVVTASEANPDINYVGVEIDFREGRRGAARLKKREQKNARVLGGCARQFLTKYVPPASLDGVHVYFPDPWWKRKHRRRRIFDDEFVDLASAALKPNGLLHSWTDVPDYFEVIDALMHHHPDFESLPTPEERPAEHDMDYRTSYERKKRKAGFPIHRGCWRRKDT